MIGLRKRISVVKKRSVGITLSYINTFLSMITGLVLSSYLLRMLGDTEYGLYQTVSSFSTYLVLLEFGTGTVMTRNISVCLNNAEPGKRKEELDRIYSTVWIISLLLSCVMIAVSFVFYFNLGNIYANSMSADQVSYAQKILLILFAYIISNYLIQNINGMLLANEEYVFAKFLTLVKMLLRFLLLLGLIFFFRYGIVIAAVDMILSLLIFAISFIYAQKNYHLKISPCCFDKRVFVTSLPMCVALLLQVLTNQANNNVDKFVIGIMMSVESVALYSVVQFVFQMFSTIATIPVGMFLPEVSKNMAKKLSPAEFTKTLVYPCRLTVLICGSILCGFFAVGKQFIQLLYGADKTEAWLYALIIMVPMFVNMTNAVCINVLDIANKRLMRSLALTGTAVLNIVLTIVFIGQWGIVGAVIATAIALVIGNIIVVNIYYKRKFDIKIFYLFKEAYKGLLPFQVIAGAIAFITARFIPHPLFALAAGGVLYLAISFPLIYLFGLSPNEKQRIKGLKRRFLKKK